MNPLVRLLDWCKRERESLQMQREMLRSGKFRILKDEGSGQVDASSEIIEQISANITELGDVLESVRKHQAGLQSFRSMRRIDARRKNASALRLRFSQSLASLRQRLSQAMVRSTIQRLGRTANPLT
jgi:hypothetical protein